MSHDLRPGSEPVPGYTLVERLGRGGFGEVWKANGPGGFQVALKFVALDENAGPVELRALEVIKHIRHPHLLGTFGSWQEGGLLIIAMELADRTLLDRLREAAGQGFPGIPAPEVFEHFLDAARALDYLNEPRHPSGGPGPQGIQHRDVKPQNLLLVGGSVKVADFGLARVLENSTTGHTGSMTPSYAAPEFFDRKTSSQSDQYSLAVSYCHLRGGRLPFVGNAAAVMAGHLMREPDLSMIPEAERPAVARALAKSPRDRWPSCRTFVQAVIDAADGRTGLAGVAMIDAPPTTEPMEFAGKATQPPSDLPALDTPPPRPRRRKRSAYMLGAWSLVAVALFLSITVLLWPGQAPEYAIKTTPSPTPPDSIVPEPPPEDSVSHTARPLGPPKAKREAHQADSSPPAPPAPSPPSGVAADDTLLKSGLSFLAKGPNDRAVAEFDEAIRLNPRSAVAFAGRSFARSFNARPNAPGREKIRQQAREDCDEALRLDPKLALAHAARANTLLFGPSPDPSEAIAEAREAIRLDPSLAFAHASLGVALYRFWPSDTPKVDARRNGMKAAVASFTEAIRLDPTFAAAYGLRDLCQKSMEE